MKKPSKDCNDDFYKNHHKKIEYYIKKYGCCYVIDNKIVSPKRIKIYYD